MLIHARQGYTEDVHPPHNTGLINPVPSESCLGQTYPNPFSERTTRVCVAYRTNAKLEVFSSEASLLGVILDEEKEAGTHEIDLDTSHVPEGDPGLSDGVYIYGLHVGDFSGTNRMILLKGRSSPSASAS